jgi:TonB family protein
MLNSVYKFSTVKVLALVAGIFFVSGPVDVLPQAALTEPAPTLQRGILLVKENKPDAAIVVLKTVTSQHKQVAEAWYYLGFAYLQKSDLKKARSALEKAIKVKRDYAPALTALGYSLLRLGKVKEAREVIERSLAVQPINADAHYTLGVIQLRLGNRDEALRLAELAIKENPLLPDAYLLKSQSIVYFRSAAIFVLEDEVKEDRRSRYQEAAEALEKYLKMVPASDRSPLWQDQLESLRAYSQPSDHPEIFTGKQVTTRIQITSKPEPEYTSLARDQQVMGTVVLKSVFTAEGEVKYILVVAGLPSGLTENAIKAARRIKFRPAIKDGRPVSMWIQLEYNFNLY